MIKGKKIIFRQITTNLPEPLKSLQNWSKIPEIAPNVPERPRKMIKNTIKMIVNLSEI